MKREMKGQYKLKRRYYIGANTWNYESKHV